MGDECPRSLPAAAAGLAAGTWDVTVSGPDRFRLRSPGPARVTQVTLRHRSAPGVLARQLVTEDAKTARLVQGVLLAVEQLAGGADPGVADQGTGPHGRLRDQEVAGCAGDIGAGRGHGA